VQVYISANYDRNTVTVILDNQVRVVALRFNKSDDARGGRGNTAMYRVETFRLCCCCSTGGCEHRAVLCCVLYSGVNKRRQCTNLMVFLRNNFPFV
jgi:hypothetical protein